MKRIIAAVCLIAFVLIPAMAVEAQAPTVDMAPLAIKTIGEYRVTKPPIETIEEEVSEYPEAESIWNYLRNLKFNEYVCAGIIGNMMVESGGYTLVIEPCIETESYYGICQWSKKYYPDVIGVSLNAQCDYLRDTIQFEFNTFGFLYAKKFDYKDFLELKDERDAALTFAKCYERCSSDSYEFRQDCATIAYKYFIGLEEKSLS